ncbi:MAG: hypothetical protein NTV72_00865 [Candidatus Taylorbacteria bacterium]|nr:hypothetical protein [Candidatus Taylorbacteria bacterium]
MNPEDMVGKSEVEVSEIIDESGIGKMIEGTNSFIELNKVVDFISKTDKDFEANAQTYKDAFIALAEFAKQGTSEQFEGQLAKISEKYGLRKKAGEIADRMLNFSYSEGETGAGDSEDYERYSQHGGDERPTEETK